MYRLEKIYKWSFVMSTEHMRLAFDMAKRSRDPNTNVGAVLFDKSDDVLLGSGANGIKYPIKETPDRLIAPKKYFYMEHAERNALFNAIRHGATASEIEGSTLYCTWAACADCARSLIAFGIKKIVTSELNLMEDIRNPQWNDSIDAAIEMFNDAGCEFVIHQEKNEEVNVLIRGKLIKVNI